MPKREFVHRLYEHIYSLYEEKAYSGWNPRVSKFQDTDPIFKVENELIKFKFINYKIFNKSFDYNKIIDWHWDQSTNVNFPKIFSKKIDIRTDKIGNAKYVWEINRLQFLPEIALKYKQTKNTKFLDLFIKINKSWMDSNPYLIGVNWYSSIEVSMRLITWFICWQILDPSSLKKENKFFAEFTEETWLPLIYMHCSYSSKHPSKYSSANNHAIAEASGLYVASSQWKFPESSKWQKKSKKILEKEICNQHTQSGINKEQAAGYIQFVLDFLLLAFIVGKIVGDSFSIKYMNRLKSIFDYIYDLHDENFNYPRYGDEDDAQVYFFDFSNPGKNFCSLLTSGAILFKSPKYKTKSLGFDFKNYLLFGAQGKKLYDDLENHDIFPESKVYQDGGHAFFRSQNESRRIYIHFNASNLGFTPMAAHGHADALSFSLNINGNKIFIDPGTYCYHTEAEWRQYFMGTLAHNTIRINRQNQAINGGPTLWISNYNTQIEEFSLKPEMDYLKAFHSGYKDLNVKHIRTLKLDKLKNIIKITDRLDNHSGKEYEYEVPLHLHPAINVVAKMNNEFELIHNEDISACIRIDRKLECSIINGQTNPIIGWYSSSFYTKEPTTVIYSKIKSNKSFQIETEISIKG